MAEKIREELERIPFSENAKDRMLNAMQMAANPENRLKNVTKVRKTIIRYRIRKMAVIAVIILAALMAGTNDAVQATIMDWFHKITMNIQHNYEQNLSEVSAPLEYEQAVNGYVLRIYQVAESTQSIQLELSLTDEEGNLAEQFYLSGLDMAQLDEESWGFGTRLVRCADQNHRLLVIQVTGSEDIDLEKFAGKEQNMTLHWMSADRTMQEISFDVAFTVDEVFREKTYTVNQYLTCDGRDIYVTELIDTGLLYRAGYEYVESDLGDNEVYALQLYDGDSNLQALGGNGALKDEETERWSMDEFFDKGSGEGKKLEIKAVKYTYSDSGKVDVTCGDGVRVEPSVSDGNKN